MESGVRRGKKDAPSTFAGAKGPDLSSAPEIRNSYRRGFLSDSRNFM